MPVNISAGVNGLPALCLFHADAFKVVHLQLDLPSKLTLALLEAFTEVLFQKQQTQFVIVLDLRSSSILLFSANLSFRKREKPTLHEVCGGDRQQGIISCHF
jgi:hypothetical protein